MVVVALGKSLSVKGETYQDVKPIIDANCARCHNEDGLADFLPLQTFEDIKPIPKKLLDALQSGKMPKDNTGFRLTADGQRLIKWFSTGEDLNPPPTPVEQHPIMKDPRLLTYQDVQSIIKTSCLGCHREQYRGERPVFETFAEIKRTASRMLKQLVKLRMPQGDKEFRFSADGRALLGWLEFGKDLQGPAPVGDDD